MIYIFLMGVAFLALVVYAVIVFSESPELAKARLGELEALPANLGKWESDETSEQAKAAKERGLRREIRYLHDEGGLIGGGTLVLQARLRDLTTDEIVEVEPEERKSRRRMKTGRGG